MRDTIKNHHQFLMADTDPSARCSYFLIRARKTIFPGDARYGITTTKKTFRLAVNRSRARRLLRDWIRFNETLLRKDMDYVFIARRDILRATRQDGRTAMKKALYYLKKLDLNAPAE